MAQVLLPHRMAVRERQSGRTSTAQQSHRRWRTTPCFSLSPPIPLPLCCLSHLPTLSSQPRLSSSSCARSPHRLRRHHFRLTAAIPTQRHLPFLASTLSTSPQRRLPPPRPHSARRLQRWMWWTSQRRRRTSRRGAPRGGASPQNTTQSYSLHRLLSSLDAAPLIQRAAHPPPPLLLSSHWWKTKSPPLPRSARSRLPHLPRILSTVTTARLSLSTWTPSSPASLQSSPALPLQHGRPLQLPTRSLTTASRCPHSTSVLLPPASLASLDLSRRSLPTSVCSRCS